MECEKMFQYILLLITICGSIGRNSKRLRRMIGGRNADAIEWPFIVHLNFHQPKPKWKICGGALIKRNWVITAAHCIEDIPDKPHYVTVGVGRIKKSNLPEPCHNYTVEKMITHPHYIKTKTENMNSTVFNWDDDIALLKLCCDVPCNLKLAELPDLELDISNVSSTTCKSAGWGNTQTFPSQKDALTQNYDPPFDLQEIDVPLITRNECKKVHGDEVSDNVYCGGLNAKDSMMSCVGDSGSPLTCLHGIDSKRILAGIMIGGDGLCRTGHGYMMFTDVARYRKWIDNTIN